MEPTNTKESARLVLELVCDKNVKIPGDQVSDVLVKPFPLTLRLTSVVWLAGIFLKNCEHSSLKSVFTMLPLISICFHMCMLLHAF